MSLLGSIGPVQALAVQADSCTTQSAYHATTRIDHTPQYGNNAQATSGVAYVYYDSSSRSCSSVCASAFSTGFGRGKDSMLAGNTNSMFAVCM